MTDDLIDLIDSHAHMDAAQFNADRENALTRATDAGVRRIINIGHNPGAWPTTLALAAAHPGIWACLGVHPHDAGVWNDALLPRLRELHAHPKAVAVGETGLDYYRDRAPRDKQREAFAAQLALARELGKPVVIHHREAPDDLLTLLRADAATHGPLRGVLHAFNGGPDFAHTLLDLGLHLGIGGPLTFKNATDLHAAARVVPLERIVFETDCPYLAPDPFRGKRNEPAYVPRIAARLAELRGMPVAAVAAATTANAVRLFGLA